MAHGFALLDLGMQFALRRATLRIVVLENVALLPSGWEAEVGRLESPEVSTSEYCMYAY